MVRGILGSIEKEKVKRLASSSVKAVNSAQPILPLPNEEPPNLGFVERVSYSPTQRDYDYISE